MKVSIIVAVYNTSQYLEQCLQSVLNQDMDPEEFEVIIVNDGSTDNSMDIINEQIKGYDNVKVIDKENEATFWSRVDGIAASCGDYVGFVDSDDWIELDMYRTMVEKAQRYGADFTECGTIYEYDNGNSSIYDQREDVVISNLDLLEKYSRNTMQYALYPRLISRKIVDRFMQEMFPYFNARRQDYRGIRNEDDLLFPLFVSMADKVLYVKEHFCHHRAEVSGSTMDELKKNAKKSLDASRYRVSAGFDVMHFTKDNIPVYRLIERKQINVIFSFMGNLLKANVYPKKEAGKLLGSAVYRFVKEKKSLTFKDTIRLWHLKLKTVYCYGNVIGKN